MRDPGAAIRKAYFDLLDGNISFDSNNVPFYDEQVPPDVNPGNYYVILGSQTETDTSNKHKFIHDVSIDIDIVTIFQKNRRKLPAETIADQILQLVRPTTQTNGLTSPADFQILVVRRLDSRMLSDQFDSSFIVRKILRFGQLISEI